MLLQRIAMNLATNPKPLGIKHKQNIRRNTRQKLEPIPTFKQTLSLKALKHC
jgi:hypothetical protein